MITGTSSCNHVISCAHESTQGRVVLDFRRLFNIKVESQLWGQLWVGVHFNVRTHLATI